MSRIEGKAAQSMHASHLDNAKAVEKHLAGMVGGGQ